MIEKMSNLEAYYLELQEEANYVKPFNKLSNIEKYNLEVSEGFRKFLIRGAWTKAIGYVILGVVVGSVLMAIGTRT